MSTSPYTIDLRKKVIIFLESGKSQSLASEVFDLNPSTVSRWWLRYKREGHYLPRRRLGKKPRLNLDSVKSYISSHNNFTSSDMGKYFGMSAAGALYWLKKLGFSYKKKPSPMWKQMKKGEINTKKR
jgi:transposase